MKRALAITFALAALSACFTDLRGVLAAFGVPEAQEELIIECCECLEAAQPSATDRSARCDDGDRKCLCADDADTCRIKLTNDDALIDDVVLVVGDCTLPGGPCAGACEGVLSYESVVDPS